MITAEQASHLTEECRDKQKTNFMSRHSSFMDNLEKEVMEACALEKTCLSVSITSKERFTESDLEYLKKFLSELKYLIRSSDEDKYSFDMYWKR